MYALLQKWDGLIGMLICEKKGRLNELEETLKWLGALYDKDPEKAPLLSNIIEEKGPSFQEKLAKLKEMGAGQVTAADLTAAEQKYMGKGKFLPNVLPKTGFIIDQMNLVPRMIKDEYLEGQATARTLIAVEQFKEQNKKGEIRQIINTNAVAFLKKPFATQMQKLEYFAKLLAASGVYSPQTQQAMDALQKMAAQTAKTTADKLEKLSEKEAAAEMHSLYQKYNKENATYKIREIADITKNTLLQTGNQEGAAFVKNLMDDIVFRSMEKATRMNLHISVRNM